MTDEPAIAGPGERDERVEDRLQAVRQRAQEPNALDFLLTALGDADWRVRKEASLALLDRASPETVVRLAALLQDEDNAGVRNAAIDVLTRMGSLAVQPLLDLWDRVSGDARKFLVDILGAIPDPRTALFLQRLLREEDNPNVLSTAIEAVGLRKLKEAVPELLGILGRGDAWLSYPAAEALGRLGDSRALDPLIRLLSDPFLQEPAVRALGALGDRRAVPPLLQRLPTLTPRGQDAALEALGALARDPEGARLVQEGLQGIPDFLERMRRGLEHASPAVRRGSVVLLGLVRDTDSAPRLVDLLEQDEEMAEVAAEALGRLGEAVAPLLLDRLARTQGKPREALCRALGLTGSVQALKGLGAVLDDPDPRVREAAAWALGRIGDPGALAFLMPLLEDEEPGVQDAAVEALAHVLAQPEAQSRLPEGRVAFWAAILSEPSPARRCNAVRVLGRLAESAGDPSEAVAALRSALQDSEAEVRLAAVDALGRLGDPAFSQALLSGLTDEAPQVRVRALQGLARCVAQGGTDIPMGALIAMLRDPDPWVQAEAARALGRVGRGESLEALRSVLQADTPPLLLITALESLAPHLQSEDAAPVRSLMGHPDPEVRRSALLALEGLGEAAWIAAQEALTDRHWAVRLAAVEVLGRIGPRASLRAPLEALAIGDPDAMVRQAASKILGTLSAA